MKCRFIGGKHMTHSSFDEGKIYEYEEREVKGEMDDYSFLIHVPENESFKEVYVTKGIFESYFEKVEII